MRVLVAVLRAGPAAALLLAATAAAFWVTRSTPRQYIYPDVPTIAPAVFACCAGVALAAVVLAMPRIEATEVTAARPLWRLRAVLVASLYLAAVPVAAVVCLAASSGWFLMPLVRDGVVVAAATFGASTLLPARLVATAALGYVIMCYYVGRGQAVWDLLLAHPGTASTVAAGAVGVVGAFVFVRYGARSLAPDDEY